MDPGKRPGLQWLTTGTSALAELHIQVVDVVSRQIGDRPVAQMRVEIAVEHRSGLADRGPCPTRLRDREPPLEQFPTVVRAATPGPVPTASTITASSRSASARLPRTVFNR